MIRLILKTCLIVMAFLITASVSVAAECADDPNECTPKKLCEIATMLDDANTIWSNSSSKAKHVTFAKNLGMTCGVLAIKVTEIITSSQFRILENKVDQLLSLQQQSSNSDSGDSVVTYSQFQVLENKVDQLMMLQKELTANIIEMNRAAKAASLKRQAAPNKVIAKPTINPFKLNLP